MTLADCKVGDWVRIRGRCARVTRQVKDSARVCSSTWIRWGGESEPVIFDQSTPITSVLMSDAEES